MEEQPIDVHDAREYRPQMQGRRLGCCGMCLKTSLIIINVITFLFDSITLGILKLCGLAIVGIGSWMWASRGVSYALVGHVLLLGPVTVATVVTGLIISIISLIGCCAAIKESRCKLITYYTVVFIVFLVVLVGGVLHLVKIDNVVRKYGEEMNKGMVLYKSETPYKKAWDDIQAKFQCCGVESPKDWNGTIPNSCCIKKNCQPPVGLSAVFVQGCFKKTSWVLRRNSSYVGFAGVCIAAVMFLDIILSCGLFLNVR